MMSLSRDMVLIDSGVWSYASETLARAARRMRHRSEAVGGEERGDAEDEEELDVVLLVLAGRLQVLHLLPDLVLALVGRDLQLVAVDEVRVAEDLRADREEIGVARQPVERVLEHEDRAGDELLRVGAGEHEELLVAAEVRHHLPVLAHVGARCRRGPAGSRGTATTRGRRRARAWRSARALRRPACRPSGNADLSVPSTSAATGELLLLQALELRRPLLERLEVDRVARQVHRRGRRAHDDLHLGAGLLVGLEREARRERHRDRPRRGRGTGSSCRRAPRRP